MGFNDITHDSTYVYATGIGSDTSPPYQNATYLRINYYGQSPIYKKIDNVRRQGWGVIALSSDSILVAGRGDIVFSNTYSFLSLVDSMGNVLQTIEDSNYLFNLIDAIAYDVTSNTLYVKDYDTIRVGSTHDSYYHIGAYQIPLTNLQQPIWEKTITGTKVAGAADLRLANDETILYTSTAGTNCPNCPYLLKADENTCADLVSCDTTFISSVSIEELSNFAPKIYPNPFNQFIQVSGIDYAQLRLLDYMGRELLLRTNITSNTKIDLPPLPNGIYLVELKKGEMKWTEKMVRQ